MIKEINNKFNVDVTSTTKVIETKGTTVKEVKIVSEEVTKKIETVFTGIVRDTGI